jgi:hypothetical protein
MHFIVTVPQVMALVISYEAAPLAPLKTAKICFLLLVSEFKTKGKNKVIR